MSGPKIDTVSLEQIKAAQLAAERNRNATMLKDALNRAKGKVASAKTRCLNVQDHQSEFLTQLKQIEDSICGALTSMATTGYPADVELARQFNNQTSVELTKKRTELDLALRPIFERIDSAIESQRTLAKIESFAAELEAAPIGDYNYFSTEFVESLLRREAERAVLKVGFVENSYQHLLEDARACIQDIQELVVSDATDASRKAKLSRIAQTIQQSLVLFQADRGEASTVEGALSLARPVVSEMKLHQEVMEELYVDCLVERNRIENASGMGVSLPALWEFGEEEELESKLGDLRRQYNQAANDAYIGFALEAVMRQHGYKVSRSVCLSQGDMAGHKMFLADDTDVGIHTFTAPNGMIMMETASIDESIRNASDGVQVERHQAASSYDRLRLVDQQVSFCELHPELLADLAEYGITTCAKSDKPPSEENSVIFTAVGIAHEAPEQQQQARRTRREGTALQEQELR